MYSSSTAANTLRTLEEAMAHPLWEKQVAFERGMLREGANNFRDRVVVAQSKDQMSRLEPVRGLLADWLPRVAQHLADWRTTSRRTKGPKPIALEHLEDADCYVVAFIGLQIALDGIASRRQQFVGLAMNVGRNVEHELQVRAWEGGSKEDKALFHDLRKRMDKEKVTSGHRARVNINRFNALLKEGRLSFHWQRWPEETQYRVGTVILEAIMRATNWFQLSPDPEHRSVPGKPSAPRCLFTARPELLEWLHRQLDDAEVLLPVYLPTLIPPRRWEGTRSGGYWTEYVMPPHLVKFKASQRDQKAWASDEYDALAMPEVMGALHFLQEVPWRINAKVLEVVQWAIGVDKGLAKLPSSTRMDDPPKPHDIDTNEEALKKWKRQRKSTERAQLKQASKFCAMSRTYRVALELKDAPCFYYPYMMDFRGRVYPIPLGLQPQGNDLAKGLLEFAEGRPVSVANGGVKWLAVQVASWWGEAKDKIPFPEREVWVRSQEALWRSIAADPKTNRQWMTADKPWQALAAIMDWVGYIEQGDGYVSHAPISVDGTCNGIQHLSAMMLDEVAGKHVNLVPSDTPQDIYKFIANALEGEHVKRLAKSRGEPGKHARYWLGVCGGSLTRGLLKRPVMVLPYGGRRDAFFKYVAEWLDEEDPMPYEAGKEEWSLRGKRLNWLVGLMLQVAEEKLEVALSAQSWLQACAKAAAIDDQPLFWVTPSGFVVRHFYGKQKTKKVEVMMNGDRMQLRISHTTKELDRMSHLRGIPPNFTHSQDAAALVLCIRKADAAGVKAFTSVHDAYGSHAADMDTVARCLREAFVQVHSGDVLKDFRNACMSVLVGVYADREGMDPLEASEKADTVLPPLPSRGSLKLEDVLQSDYFFA